MHTTNDNLSEVGALPEYSSREGCGVEVLDSCDEGSREFGRLVIHRIHIGIALWTLSFWVRACELYIGILFLGFGMRIVIHRIHIGIAFWSLSLWVRACELYIGISFLGFRMRIAIHRIHIGIAFWSLSF